jgi:cytochrome c oxidase subunit 2
VIALAVFSAMIYSIVRFRRSQGAVAANFDHSTRAEIVWTIIPVAILIGMAIPAAATLVRIEDTRNSELTVKVTGYQWMWHYDYLDEKVAFFSRLARDSDAARQLDSGIDPNTVPNYVLEVDRPMVVPVGKKVRVLLTAADVIHAWWVPEFAMKKDAIPGFVNEMWFRADETGIYRGQCTELCGRDHAFMPIVVEVKSQAEYDSWLQAQQAGTDTGNAVATAVASAKVSNR